MAIATKRFDFLDKEMQVGSANFSKLLDSSVQNIAQNAFNTVSLKLTELLKTSIQLPIQPATDLLNTLKAYERKAKDTLGSVIDFSKMLPDELNDFTNTISGGKNDIGKSIGRMLNSCSTGANGLGYGGRPYRPSINCNNGKFGVGYGGNSYGCNASSYGDLMSKLGADGSLRTFSDIAKALTALLSLAKRGYNLGICGVFGSLINSSNFSSLGLGNTEYSKAAGVLLSTLGMAKDTRGWIDVASASVVGDLTPLQTNPGAVSDLFNSYAIPQMTREADLPGLATTTFEAVGSLDNLWKTSLIDSLLSVGRYTATEDLQRVAQVKLNDFTFDEDNLDTVRNLDDDYVFAALAFS